MEEEIEEENIPEFPEAIAFGDLEKTHPEYNPTCPLTNIGMLDKHDHLYRGGREFRKNIEHYLVKRQIEQGGGTQKMANKPGINPKSEGSIVAGTAAAVQSAGTGQGGAKQWEARKKRAWYTPFVSFIIDFIVAAVNQNQPSVANPLLEKSDESKMEYWRRFNENADGHGTDLAALSRAAIQEILVHKRAYFYVSFPKVEASSLGDQEAAGGLDGRVSMWGARFVDDWEYDSDGKLIWVRTHSIKKVRPTPTAQPTDELHCWTYITANGKYEYEVQFSPEKKPEENDLITRTEVSFHDVGVLPVVPVKISDSFWVMDRLADTVLALFNRESAATWTLDQMAFAILVATTSKPVGTIAADDICGVQLDVGEGLKFEAPDSAIFTAQQADIERLKATLFSVIHMMALQAEKDKGGNPASGEAKELDMGGMSTLLGAFAAPLRDAIETVVDIIQAMREESDMSLAVQGLDKFDVQSLEKKIKNAQEFLKLGEMIPESARKWAALDVALAMTANAPAKVRGAVEQEIMEKKEEPKKAEPTNENQPVKEELEKVA